MSLFIPQATPMAAGVSRGLRADSRGSRLGRSACGASDGCRTTIGRASASVWPGVSGIHGSLAAIVSEFGANDKNATEWGADLRLGAARHSGGIKTRGSANLKVVPFTQA